MMVFPTRRSVWQCKRGTGTFVPTRGAASVLSLGRTQKSTTGKFNPAPETNQHRTDCAAQQISPGEVRSGSSVTIYTASITA
jgi:hypothetical protein